MESEALAVINARFYGWPAGQGNTEEETGTGA
jgi:hypothetical protein